MVDTVFPKMIAYYFAAEKEMKFYSIADELIDKVKYYISSGKESNWDENTLE